MSLIFSLQETLNFIVVAIKPVLMSCWELPNTDSVVENRDVEMAPHFKQKYSGDG